ncbi:MAG: SET domain-containing protein-lysine N-methyltransferase [Candidatus Komeilibacteria bacterium]|nr:SET domain-containing protein-lysine N-methyltransferase [Candidatus Komeilibacteria bacterium]
MLTKRKSPIQGYGIFTDSPIKKGEAFYKIPSDKILSQNHHQAARIGAQQWVWDEQVLNFVNHSCEPNVFINVANLTLVALKNIRAGEEITCNYDFSEGEQGFHFICQCGSKFCEQQVGEVVRN